VATERYQTLSRMKYKSNFTDNQIQCSDWNNGGGRESSTVKEKSVSIKLTGQSKTVKTFCLGIQNIPFTVNYVIVAN
jgi:hypothetical protein